MLAGGHRRLRSKLMSSVRWDPAVYGRYGDERGRPFFELTTRIEADTPELVVDLGCGSGELTEALAARWPEALVRGIDSSPEMIARAPRDRAVQFSIGAAEQLDATGVDVLVSNAALQWVPTHRELLPRWAGQLNPGGWLAFQVPANFDAPSHALMRELAESQTWSERLTGVLRGAESTAPPAEYLDLLTRAGLDVDAWATEYEHVLAGEDPVLEWVRGTGLRPVLQALSEDDADQFCAEYAEGLREAYPRHDYGTVFGFRRTFVVAHRRD
jgi:trans-aconitate 2-methyltransferase